jgi:DNA polymerase-1
MPKEKKDILLLIDGNALVHRGFHAIPHLSNKKGQPTNGVYGFALLFLKALKELHPEYVAAAFDLPGPTFRDKLYAEYKAGRVKAPDELYQQIPKVKELLGAFNVPVFEKEGYEADDLIGSLAELAKKEPNLETVILTGDLDTLQLVDDNVKVFAPKKGITEIILYDREAVRNRYGLTPEQLLDFKALRGDPSDNIPGVKGIGDKTAIELLQRFKDLDGIYENLGNGEVKPRILELLTNQKEQAYLSQKLARIVRDLKLEFELENAVMADYDEQKVYKIFQELEFKSLLDKLPKADNSIKYQVLSIKEGDEEGDKLNYKLVDTPEKFEKFLQELKKQKIFAIDTETTSTKPVEAELVGIGFSWKQGEAYYLPVSMLTPSSIPPHRGEGKKKETSSPLMGEDKGGGELKAILENPDLTLIGHNLKYDYLVLKRFGINLRGNFFDTMIAAYLLNPGVRNFDLDTLTFNEFGFRKTKIENLIGEGKGQISMAQVPLEKIAAYCGEDVDWTWRLWQKLSKELSKNNLLKIFEEIEMPLVPVLAEMEYWGVKIAPKVLKKLSQEASEEIKKIEGKIYRLAGGEFNIGSPIQLKQILFEKLGIPSEELKKGKTGLSTAAAELEKLRGLHPIIDLIFEWRELTKLQNTYLDALPELINKETGRVHTSFNQTIAATGRLSSSDPNLQNIPVRTEMGRKTRRAFVAEKGYKLVSIDYSQIELRLAAHLSGDRKMIEVFQKGGDIHEATAREIFDLSLPSHERWGGDGGGVAVSPEMRRAAKTINFGVLYGLSAYGLKSRIPGVSQGEAQDFIDKYFDTYRGLTKYLEEIIAGTRRLGYVKNELGRIRYLSEIKSSQWQVRSAAERAAINMPFQSLSADIIKMAMNKLREADLTNKEDCRLLLQVHDELVYEIAEGKIDEYIPKIVKIMQEIYKLKVPLVVEAKAGENWEEMERIEL